MRLLRPALSLAALALVLAALSLASARTAAAQAAPSERLPLPCRALGLSIAPAGPRVATTLDGPACLYDGPAAPVSRARLPPRRPQKTLNGLAVPSPGYHHVGSWLTEVGPTQRASVHSSSLAGVGTGPGDCFFRTSHLVYWDPAGNAFWVESGELKCGLDAPAIFVYIGGFPGSPGYGFGPVVAEGVEVRTFAEWECLGRRVRVSAGYLGAGGQKVYIPGFYRFDTRQPCVDRITVDNNGEAFNADATHFPVARYAARDTQICDMARRGWSCRPWTAQAFPATSVVTQLESYAVTWTSPYADWHGSGQ